LLLMTMVTRQGVMVSRKSMAACTTELLAKPTVLSWTDNLQDYSARPPVARCGKGSRRCLTASSCCAADKQLALVAINNKRCACMQHGQNGTDDFAGPTFRAAINKRQLGSNPPGTWGRAHWRAPCRGLVYAWRLAWNSYWWSWHTREACNRRRLTAEQNSRWNC